MAEVTNLAKNERIIRVILGVIFVIVGFSLHGFLKPLFLFLGLCSFFTAYIAY